VTQKSKDIKNIWGWLNEITLYKTPSEEISQESWNNFNSYMIHRYVSMDMGYIDIVNYVQKINPQSKKQIYSIYREMIPKKKVYLKYVKNENKKNYKEVAEYVADYLECSLGEADQYIPILQDHGIRNILWKMGVEEKETEKLIKKIEL
jgi:phage-related tail protein